MFKIKLALAIAKSVVSKPVGLGQTIVGATVGPFSKIFRIRSMLAVTLVVAVSLDLTKSNNLVFKNSNAANVATFWSFDTTLAWARQ